MECIVRKGMSVEGESVIEIGKVIRCEGKVKGERIMREISVAAKSHRYS